MRVVIADDSCSCVRACAGYSRSPASGPVSVVGDGDGLEEVVSLHRPDVAIIDIRMPPSYTDEGARAAARLRERWPDLGILLLSQSLESRYAAELAQHHPEGFGYLLKDRVVDIDRLVEALTQLEQGGTVLDPDVVAHLLGRRSARERVNGLSPREQGVLALMAAGQSNSAMARELGLTDKTIESHISNISTSSTSRPRPMHIAGSSPSWPG